MALIDERGRLFGRVNLIDASVGLIVLLLVTGVYVGYRLLRLPPEPIIEQVEPAVQQAGDGRRLALRGQNFLPFMRVYVQRTGESTKAVHEVHPEMANDPYTLVNSTQAKFLVESPRVGEIRLPDDMGAGTYDLVFYNETERVAIKEAAFRLTEPPPPAAAPGVPKAAIRAYGAFTGIERANQSRLTRGLRVPTGQEDAWGEIIDVDAPRPETAQVRGSDTQFAARVEGRLEMPAVLRIRCAVLGNLCNIGTANITAGMTLPIQVGDRVLNFNVQDIGPDVVELTRQAQVEVRFFTKPEIARVVRPRDVDRPKLPPNARSLAAAVLVSRGAPEELKAMTGVSLPEGGQSLQVEERIVAFNASLTVPVMLLPTGWFYKTQPIKAGSSLVFETTDYAVRGMILSVNFSRPAASKTASPP